MVCGGDDRWKKRTVSDCVRTLFIRSDLQPLSRKWLFLSLQTSTRSIGRDPERDKGGLGRGNLREHTENVLRPQNDELNKSKHEFNNISL